MVHEAPKLILRPVILVTLLCLSGVGPAPAAELPLDDVYNIARNSFTASFVDEGRKRDWIETLDTAFAAG